MLLSRALSSRLAEPQHASRRRRWQSLPPFVTGDQVADEVKARQFRFPLRGTLGPSVSSKHPLVSRSHVEAIGAALDTGTIASEILSAGAPVSPLAVAPAIAGRGYQQSRLAGTAWPRIHEGMGWGAVGLVPTAPGKRTRHHLVTPDRLPTPCYIQAPITKHHPQITVSLSTGTAAKPSTTQPAPRTRQHRLTPRALSGKGC